jgi:hypothetical protein
MSSQKMLSVRFPDRRTEFTLSTEKPKVGDRLRRNGDEWEVIAVGKDAAGHVVVTLSTPGDGEARPT